MVLLSATCTTGMVAAEFIMLSSGLCAELCHHFEALTSGMALCLVELSFLEFKFQSCAVQHHYNPGLWAEA